MSRQVFIPRKARLHHPEGGLGTQTITLSVPLAASPSAERVTIGYGTPLGQLGSAVPAVSSPKSLCPPAPLLLERMRRRKGPDSAQPQLKHPCAINTFQQESKAQPHLSYMRKIISIPGKSSTQPVTPVDIIF